MCSRVCGGATVEGFCLVQAEPSLPVFIGSNQTGGIMHGAPHVRHMLPSNACSCHNICSASHQGTFGQFPALGKIILLTVRGCVCLGEGD